MLVNITALAAGLVELMRKEVISGVVLGIDDTSVRLQDPSLPGKMPYVDDCLPQLAAGSTDYESLLAEGH